MTASPTTGPASTCWCCGEERAESDMVRLGCHHEATLCTGCIRWLADQQPAGRQLRGASPILVVRDLESAMAHYERLGFETESWSGGGYAFLHRDGVELHLGHMDGLDPAANTVSCYLDVADADTIHAEWSATNPEGRLEPPIDTIYGMREGRYIDPDGNTIRYGSPITPPVPDGGADALAADDPLAIATCTAIQQGDTDTLGRLLTDHPDLATTRIADADASRSLLHAATDWPGHFPAVANVIALLAEAGADVNARVIGPHTETPLHWAASSNDVAALDALLDAGADIEADGAVLGGGTPLADAVGFGQWAAARRLVQRGATTRLQDAAALGLTDRVEETLDGEPAPGLEDVTGAFWAACHGDQADTARVLLSAGADLNWIGWGELTPLDVAEQAGAVDVVTWLRANGAARAADLT